MGPTVDPLIIAALADGQGQFRRDVAELAGHQHLLEAVPWLATFAAGGDADTDVVATAQAALIRMGLSVPDEADARAVINRELEKIDAGIPTDSLPNETGLWWTFDPATKKFTSRELISCERRSLIHARLARNYLALATATPAERQLAIISAIEAAHVLGENPSAEIAATCSIAVTMSELSNSLGRSLTNKPGQRGDCLRESPGRTCRPRGDTIARWLPGAVGAGSRAS